MNQEGVEFKITKELETNEREIADYSIGVVNLVVELCKANASLVIELVEVFYPFESICAIIAD